MKKGWRLDIAYVERRERIAKERAQRIASWRQFEAEMGYALKRDKETRKILDEMNKRVYRRE